MRHHRVNRRRFIAGASAAAWLLQLSPFGLAAAAQKRRVAWLTLPGEPPGTNHVRFVRERLAELGFDEARMEWKEFEWSDRRPARDIAASIGQWPAELLIVRFTELALALAPVIHDTPIVFCWVADPVANKLVSNLARPEANLTGVFHVYDELAAKRFEFALQVLPRARRLGLVFEGPRRPGQPLMRILDMLTELAKRSRVVTTESDVADAPSFARALERLASQHMDVILPVGLIRDPRYSATLAEFQDRFRIPVIDDLLESVERGVVAAMAEDTRDHFRRAADVAALVLSGRKPSSIPVQAASRVDVAVNPRAAKAIGLELPAAVLARATRVY